MRRFWLPIMLISALFAAACGGGGGGSSAPAPRHIIVVQDSDPWNSNALAPAMEEIGYTAGAGAGQYEIIASSGLAARVLISSQDVLVIQSVQLEAYYQTIADNSAKIEAFLNGGGIVFFSACGYGNEVPWIPGGVTRVPYMEPYNDNLMPASKLMEGIPDEIMGDYASHDYFTGLPADAIVYAASRNTGEATLAEYAFGAGRVLLSGMTLEITFEYDWDGSALFTRLFRYAAEPWNPLARGEAWRIKLLRDGLPWGVSDPFANAMTSLGYSASVTYRNNYEIHGSAGLASLDLIPGRDVLAVASVQSPSFYTVLAANMNEIADFVENGGVLLFSVCDMNTEINDAGVVLPGGVTIVNGHDSNNYIMDAASPLLTGLPDPIIGSRASHAYVSNLPAGAHIYVAGETAGSATLVEYPYGNGKVILTGMTLEYAYFYDWDAAPIYPRLFAYAMGDL